MKKYIVTAWDSSHQVIEAVYYSLEEAEKVKQFLKNNGISAIIQTEEIPAVNLVFQYGKDKGVSYA